METANDKALTCPKCGQSYTAHPAISRVDNQTAICPLCGTREALENMGVPQDEIEKIVETIKNYKIR